MDLILEHNMVAVAPPLASPPSACIGGGRSFSSNFDAVVAAQFRFASTPREQVATIQGVTSSFFFGGLAAGLLGYRAGYLQRTCAACHPNRNMRS